MVLGSKQRNPKAVLHVHTIIPEMTVNMYVAVWINSIKGIASKLKKIKIE